MESEPMDVDDLEVYKFDDLIDNRIKLNDPSDRLRNNVVPFEPPEARYENKAGAFLTGIDIFSEEEKQKKEERAKRFGLKSKSDRLSEEKEDLYKSLGVDKDSESAKNLRLNVIHMRGLDEMSTKDVFKYFEYYAPSSIEWINDLCCNVVWLDSITAARALKGLSKRIVGLRDSNVRPKQEKDSDDLSMVEVDEEEDKSENVVHMKDIKYPLPPGQWRKGVDCAKSKNIFLRFATLTDRKPVHAEKLSDYYKKHGNPNFGGERGIISQSRKRVYKQMQAEGSSETNSVRNGAASSNPWGDLSRNWGVNDSVEREFVRPVYTKELLPPVSSGVKGRLGFKTPNYTKDATSSDSENDEDSHGDSDDDWCGRSKVLRMRMHADDEEVKIKKKRARTDVSPSRSVDSSDLRSRIQNKRVNPIYDEAIQIVVANPRALRRESSEEGSEAEEGEIMGESDSGENDKDDDDNDGCEVEIEDEEEDDEDEEDDSDSSSGSSEISEKEVQGPKGSVVKVVMKPKAKVASTVWARLNKVPSAVTKVKEPLSERINPKRDLRHSIKGDLRSRLGNSVRRRSPLRIEVKNDKYA